MLEHFFTDLSAEQGMLRLLEFLPKKWLPRRVRQLRERRPALSASRVTAFTFFGLRTNLRWSRTRTATELTRAYLNMGRGLSERVLKAGLGQAKGVYALNGEGLELLAFAKRRGLVTILDQTIAPKEIETKLIEEERAGFPGWERTPEPDGLLNAFVERQHLEWAAADLILCGSEFVREGIGKVNGPVEKCAVVPYGGAQFSGRIERSPAAKLHVLTVGTVGLRKGSPYVFEVARSLAALACFRMAGSIDLCAEGLKHGESVELLGRLPRSQMNEQYRWADAFLFPSLCEGSAMAVYEALSAGLPVITTPNAGTVVRHGVDGLLVAPRDVARMKDAIVTLAADRALLEAMSRNARERAGEFTMDRYGQRLVATLQTAMRAARSL